MDQEFFARRETVDPEVRAYVSSLVTAVGGTSIEEHGRYVLGDDAIGCLKDLRRWIKFYDEKLGRLDVQRVLAESNFLKGDILEILADWPETGAASSSLRAKISLLCLELLVPLTWSLEVPDHEFTAHHHKHLPYLRLTQVGYKRAILQHDSKKILRQFVRIALPSMAEARAERSPRDEGIIRLVLYAIRNVAMIAQPADLPDDGDELEISRSTLIDVFHEQDVLQMLLAIASSMGDEFAVQDVVVLEVLFHLLKGVDPTKLFMKEEELIQTNTSELKELIRKEKAMHAGYARYAPTRHNRFGTMLWLTRDDEKISTVSGQGAISGPDKGIKYLDKAKKWNKPKQRGRRRVYENASTEFDMEVAISGTARRRLRKFVEDFLDSSFNPLFVHLRRSIEREQERVLETHKMQNFYLMGWFLKAEAARRAALKRKAEMDAKAGATQAESGENDGFGIIAGVMNQETFVLLHRFMQTAYDNKFWQDLNAGMKCFTQILLTVQQMEASTLDDDQEIAENIQNRIFYEETTHQRIIDLLRNYKDQGRGYLDAVTELSHVFIRMLESYSKQNADMQIRSRRRVKKKRKQNDTADANDAEAAASGAEDNREIEIVSRERRFDFTRFSVRFMTQGCVNTFVEFTKLYKDLSLDQLKRAHRFFYRVAFKLEMTTLLFRMDIISLFNQMIKGEDCLDHDLSCYKDWEELTRQIFKRLIKRLPDHPEVMVEMLFSKIPATLFYLEHGYEKEVTKSAPRPPAELQVSPLIAEDDRIGVVTEAMVSAAQFDMVKWVKDELNRAAEERRAWADAEAARKSAARDALADVLQAADEEGDTDRSAATGDDARVGDAPIIVLSSTSADIKTAMFKNNKLRLLMNLVGFHRQDDEDEPGATWHVPSSLSADDLSAHLRKIQVAESTLSTLTNYPDAKAPETYLKRKSTYTSRHVENENPGLSSDSDGEDSFDENTLFPAGGPTARAVDNPESRKKNLLKRRRRPKDVESNGLVDEEKARKRRAAEKEKRAKIKSDLWVRESDDETDDERDQDFFRKEGERRTTAGMNIAKALATAQMQEQRDKAASSKKRKSPSRSASSAVDSASESEIEVVDRNTHKRRKARNVIEISDDSISSSDSDDERVNNDTDDDQGDADAGTHSTPITSQRSSHSPIANVGESKVGQAQVDVDMQDSDESPVKALSLPRRNVRAGFVVDDSDSG